MTEPMHAVPVGRVPTGIPGVDEIAGGGLPAGRNTLVTGIAGAGKTVFAMQFLAEGIRAYGEAAVYVTLTEPPEDVRRNAAALGFDVGRWEDEGSWVFVDASPVDPADDVVAGPFDFSGLAVRILAAVERADATRVAIDSLSAVYSRFEDEGVVRAALRGLLRAMRPAGVTVVITIEGSETRLGSTVLGTGEHVAESIVRLEYLLVGEARRRTIEVAKLRGGTHRSGRYPFIIRDGQGIMAIPLGGVRLIQEVSDERVRSGSDVLDEMCGGGLFRDSVVLVAGATGTGKSLVASTFLAEGLAVGERGLFVGFEESAGQVMRNARNWGHDLELGVASDQLRLLCRYPESAAIEEHLADIVRLVDSRRPNRLVVDSLTAVERITDAGPFREFVLALTGLVKERGITGLYTAATGLLGESHPTGAHVSVLADAIVVLHYVETPSDIRRVIGVLKLRGSDHDHRMRAFDIDDTGLHIGEPLGDVAGILAAGSLHRGGPGAGGA